LTGKDWEPVLPPPTGLSPVQARRPDRTDGQRGGGVYGCTGVCCVMVPCVTVRVQFRRAGS